MPQLEASGAVVDEHDALRIVHCGDHQDVQVVVVVDVAKREDLGLHGIAMESHLPKEVAAGAITHE